MLAAASSIAELIKSGALRPLAISTAERSPRFPEIPTLKEQGLADGTYAVWIGLFAPAKLPVGVKARLAQALDAARADPEVVSRLEAGGQTLFDVKTPEQFAALVRSEEQRLRKIVKDANIRVD
jgi:tripartite-type tricarboxylate transporter receptor subunit TctC